MGLPVCVCISSPFAIIWLVLLLAWSSTTDSKKLPKLHPPSSCTFIDRNGSCAHRRMEITGSWTRHLRKATPRLYLRALAEQHPFTGKSLYPQGSLYHFPNKINCWAKVSLVLAPWILCIISKCSLPHCWILAHHSHFHLWIKLESGRARSGLWDQEVRNDKEMCKQMESQWDHWDWIVQVLAYSCWTKSNPMQFISKNHQHVSSAYGKLIGCLGLVPITLVFSATWPLIVNFCWKQETKSAAAEGKAWCCFSQLHSKTKNFSSPAT